MKVKATQRGYYGSRVRNEGDVFEIENQKVFSPTWMEKAPARKGKVDPDQAQPPAEA